MIRNNLVLMIWRRGWQQQEKSLVRLFSNEVSCKEKAELNEKVVKVSIIGMPNSGKSTFINTLVQHRICPTSSKVHTTTNFAKAITNKNNSQIIVFDTPGLVTKQEIKKHKLNSSFISSCRHSIHKASVIGVLHDVSNRWTRNAIHPTILDLLEEFNKKESFLILNKIDKLRSKRVLLDLVKTLTCHNLALSKRGKLTHGDHESTDQKDPKVGWPNFSNVFMVSSLNGDGFERVIDFIETKSQVESWEYRNNEFTDKKPEELIEEFVRARLLDYLPQEIPYLLQCQLEFFSHEHHKIYASVIVTCPNERIEKLLCGVSNGKLKQIIERVTSDLVETFKVPIQLTISTVCLKKDS